MCCVSLCAWLSLVFVCEWVACSAILHPVPWRQDLSEPGRPPLSAPRSAGAAGGTVTVPSLTWVLGI